MTELELLRELQDGRTQVEFAALLGISQPFISMIYRGERRLGMASVRKLLEAFPQRSAEIVSVFLLGIKRDCAEPNACELEAAQ